MTREEAIKKLEHYRYCLNFQYGWYSKDDDEAFDMAIKALEQQPNSSEKPNKWVGADVQRCLTR